MRLRMVLSFVLIVLVSITSMVLIARQNTANEVRAFMYRGGMTTSSELVQSLADYYRTNGTWQGVETLLFPTGHSFGRNTTGSGKGAGMGGMGTMMSQRLILANSQGTIIADSSFEMPTGSLNSNEMSSALPIKVDAKTEGYLLIQGGMGYSQADEQTLLSRLNSAAITAGLIAGGFSLLLALMLAYRLLRPVQDLTEAAGRLAQGDLSQRVKVAGKDELAVLGNAFNHMANSLQQSQEIRKALTADIAHELRTPLSVQRANLEAMQDGVYPLSGENLEPILEQNMLLTRLVDDLRVLALAESGELQLEKTPTDLAALSERVVERFRPQAEKQDVALAIEHANVPAQQVAADPMRIEQILNNLLSNALRHTPPGGKILVRTGYSGGKLQVMVQDSGPGVSAEALPFIFERFYRADKSRSRSEGGTGLGLAIARRLAELHGGNLTASNHPQGGALFTLTVPAK